MLWPSFRTRSAHGGPGGGSESGYSSDTYNAMNIKRLERDTSVDRMSTGSRESNRLNIELQKADQYTTINTKLLLYMHS